MNVKELSERVGEFSELVPAVGELKICTSWLLLFFHEFLHYHFLRYFSRYIQYSIGKIG